MSITSIGSSFSNPMPVQAPNPATPVETIVASTAKADAENQDQRSGDGEKRFPARLASTKEREALSRPSMGVLLAAQEEAQSHPSVSAHSGTTVYGAAG
jgi:hypothetical protein